MTFSLRDIIYFIIFASSVATIWGTFKNRINNLEKCNTLFKKVLFKDSGELNFINIESCNKQQQSIQKILEKRESDLIKLKTKIEELNENILRIMIHMNIDDNLK